MRQEVSKDQEALQKILHVVGADDSALRNTTAFLGEKLSRVKLKLEDAARILEKQNRLQMSQVLFRCLCIDHQAVLLFKDSKSGTAELGGTRFSDHF